MFFSKTESDKRISLNQQMINNTNKRFFVDEMVFHLKTSFQHLEWTVNLVPASWHKRLPDGSIRGLLDHKNRSAAEHVAHLALYEELLANPVLSELKEGRDGTQVVSSGHVSWMMPQVMKLVEKPLSEIIQRLRLARLEQIKIVESFDNDTFNIPLTRLWSTGASGVRMESAGWVAAKTVQHTGEHVNHLFRFALFNPDNYWIEK
jgi:hypothetical protein